jgi:hypothetical protein
MNFKSTPANLMVDSFLIVFMLCQCGQLYPTNSETNAQKLDKESSPAPDCKDNHRETNPGFVPMHEKEASFHIASSLA